MDAAELQDSPQVQLLTCVHADGEREPALRIPNELLLDSDTEN
jgi:hypothetical protein